MKVDRGKTELGKQTRKIDRGQTEMGKQARQMTGKNGALMVLLLVVMALTSIRAQGYYEYNVHPCQTRGLACNSYYVCCGYDFCRPGPRGYDICISTETWKSQCIEGKEGCSDNDCCPGSSCRVNLKFKSVCMTQENWLKQCIPTGALCEDPWNCCEKIAKCDPVPHNKQIKKCIIHAFNNPYCRPQEKPCTTSLECCRTEACSTTRSGALLCIHDDIAILECSGRSKCKTDVDCCRFKTCQEGTCIAINWFN